MLIAGAKGFAKQLLDVIFQLQLQDGLVFYDDQDPHLTSLYEYPVLKSSDEAADYFLSQGPAFALGLGNPRIRRILNQRLEAAGGTAESLISPLARIAEHAQIGVGSTILTGAVIENDVLIGKRVLVNLNALACHDSRVGDDVEISPGAILTGAVQVGEGSFIGAGAVINPGVKIGANVIVGSGAVVIRDVPDGMKVAGVPARAI